MFGILSRFESICEYIHDQVQVFLMNETRTMIFPPFQVPNSTEPLWMYYMDDPTVRRAPHSTKPREKATVGSALCSAPGTLLRRRRLSPQVSHRRVRRVLVVRRGLVRGPAVRPVEGGGEADEAVVEDLCHGDDGEAHAEPQQPARVGQEADAGDLLIFYELFHVGILRHDRDCIKTVRARARRPPL